MTSLIKDKRNFSQVKKKRINWSQSLNTSKAFALTFAQYKKSLQYILLLKNKEKKLIRKTNKKYRWKFRKAELQKRAPKARGNFSGLKLVNR